MKALSLWQPHASLMALDLKRIETRSWQMNYRGPLVICSTASVPGRVKTEWGEAEHRLVWNEPTRDDWMRIVDALRSRGVERFGQLPMGHALCIVDVVDCVPTELIYAYADSHPSQDELAFGDYSPGRFAIITENCRAIMPVAVRGRQRLFEVAL